MRRLTIDFIKKEFKKEGYVLITDVYKNNRQKLDYICDNGHKHNTKWCNWQQNNRCSCCIKKNKKTISLIKKEFEKEKYKLLTTTYNNSDQKLDYICPKGHKHSISWHSWQQGGRCPYCYGNAKLNIDFIRGEFEKEGYRLLTTEYKNAHQKLDYVCDRGHRYSIIWNDWQQGKRCLMCYREDNRGENHPSWKGGISCEPYCEVWVKKEFKKMIKERDDYQCQNPDCWGKDGRAGMLCVHHIDYVKKNCDVTNLITLCMSCNTRANFNREQYTNKYRTIINKKQLSNCSFI